MFGHQVVKEYLIEHFGLNDLSFLNVIKTLHLHFTFNIMIIKTLYN